MAIYWLGTATKTAQVADATFATYDVTTTRRITIGNTYIEAADSGGTLTAALTALAVLLNASTHPYFSTITWSSTATKIIGTADVAGVPFVFLASVSGGTGTVSNTFTITTANSGPCDWSVAANWSGGAVPVDTDEVIIRDSDVNISWGLSQSAVELAKLIIEQSYTGKIGLDWTQFIITADGETAETTYPKTEYRTTYLTLQAATVCEIGQDTSAGSPTGSPRLNINLGTDPSTTTIFNTAATSAESGRPCVRLLCNDAATVVYVRSAPGGVGIAMDAPGETSTLAKVSVIDTSGGSLVYVGRGVTITTFEQNGGNNILQAAGTITTVKVNGGTLVSEGDYTITTVTMLGGTFHSNNIKTGGNAITAATLNDGTLDGLQSNEARTWATVVTTDRGTLSLDGSVVTITTQTDSTTKRFTTTYQPA